VEASEAILGRRVVLLCRSHVVQSFSESWHFGTP
jgi:hypothetical protein